LAGKYWHQPITINEPAMVLTLTSVNALKTALTLTGVIVSKTELNYNMLFKEKRD
jgi:hypothetical protein